MVRSLESIERELLCLPIADRARVAQLLLASLDADRGMTTPSQIDAAWEGEISRRVAELQAGTVSGVPAEVVFAELVDG